MEVLLEPDLDRLLGLVGGLDPNCLLVDCWIDYPLRQYLLRMVVLVHVHDMPRLALFGVLASLGLVDSRDVGVGPVPPGGLGELRVHLVSLADVK